MSDYQNMHLLPSDIARLVLGYLKDKGLKKTLVAFLQESPDLSEYWRLLNSGIMPTSTVMGHTLQSILEEYATLSIRVKTLNARLAQLSGSAAQASNENIVTTHLEKHDIDAVLESHRKAELNRKRHSMRQKAKRRSDSQGKKHLPTNEISSEVSRPHNETSGQVSHQAGPSHTNESSQMTKSYQPESHKADNNLNKSSEADDLDEDFEFDSLDRLLADTKLHEKLAESINKALKRDQVITSERLNTPPTSSKSKDTNQRKEGVGCDQREDNTQKDTSAVVDDIISMTADEPGLEQLLSLFQFQPETAPKSSHSQAVENQTQSAALYIPDVGSKAKSSLFVEAKNSDQCLLRSQKNLDTLNHHNVNIKSAPLTLSTGTKVVKNNSELSTHQQQPVSAAVATSFLDHHEMESQTFPKLQNLDKTKSKQTLEENQKMKEECKSSAAPTDEPSLLSGFSQEESSMKASNPTQNLRKPRVKRWPKKLFKGDHTNQTPEHDSLSLKDKVNVDNHVKLKNPVKTNSAEAVNSSTNLKGTRQCTENSSLPQTKEPECLSVEISQDKDNASSKHLSNDTANPSENDVGIKNREGNDSKKGSENHSQVLVSFESIEMSPLRDFHPTTSLSPIKGQQDCPTPPVKNPSNDHSANCPSKSPSKHALSVPQAGMEENSLSVFSLINKCTAEIIGEVYVPRNKRDQDHGKKMEAENKESEATNGDEKLNPAETKSKVEPQKTPNLEKSKTPECIGENGNDFELVKGSGGCQILSDKEDVDMKLKTAENDAIHSTGKTPFEISSPERQEEYGVDDYSSDSSFDEKISTPNAVYVKPVYINVGSTRKKNYKIVDSCLQDMLAKIRGPSGEVKRDCSVVAEEKINANVQQGESTNVVKRDDSDEKNCFNIDNRNREEDDNKIEEKEADENREEDNDKIEDLEADENREEDNDKIEEKEAGSIEDMQNNCAGQKLAVFERLHDFSATISTPFVTREIASTDSSPRKLVGSKFRINDSSSMPASFSSSRRERYNIKGHHSRDNRYSRFTPSVSDTMSASSRKVIACNIAHSPFIPSHLKRKGPSRRITPTEVSFTTPSPLGIMSPSSPAEFIIDLSHSPSQSNTLIKDAKIISAKYSEKDSNNLKEETKIIELKSPLCTNNCENSNFISEKEIIHVSEGSVGKRNVELVSSLSNGNCNTTQSLPASPSQRKPRRVVPTLVSKIVSKVGGDSLFSSSSCSQNGTAFHLDESKIVSSSSDPTSPHDEAEAFRMLKNIFQSYSKPQPNQEITSSNFSKISHSTTPKRKCGCATRDVCSHVKRLRHASTPMRKCGCASREVCTHVKGKGKKLFKRRSASFSKTNIKEIPTTLDLNKLDESKKVDSDQPVPKIDVDAFCDSSSKDGVNSKDDGSQSSGAFIAVGTVVNIGSDRNSQDDQMFANDQEVNCRKDNDTLCDDNVTTNKIISEGQDTLCHQPNIIPQEKEFEEIAIAQTIDNIVETIASSDNLNDDGNCVDVNSLNKNDNDSKTGESSKANSQCSNESATSDKQSTDLDHHDNISLAMPYFPELSNTFDFFKLKKGNFADSEAEKPNLVKPVPSLSLGDNYDHEANPITKPNNNVIYDDEANTTRKPKNNVIEISPLPGTLYVGNSLGNPLKDPQTSSCLISQAMEQCGIPFEPSELTMMELNRLVETNDEANDNIQIDSNGRESTALIPATHEPIRMQLRSSKRQSNLASSSSSMNKSKKALPLQPSSKSTMSPHPHILFPDQNPSQSGVNPSPMTPGTVAYFFQPNQPPTPFTILADGTVIVLSPSSVKSLQPAPPPPPPPSSNHLRPLIPLPPLPPLPTLLPCSNANITKSDTFVQCSSNMNKKPVISKPKPPQSCSTNAKKKDSDASKVKKKDSEPCVASKERKKDSESCVASKVKKKDSKSSRVSKKKSPNSCMESVQKIALRRKIEDNASSPQKASVSTYFQKPKLPTKRKLTLTAKISQSSKSRDEQLKENTNTKLVTHETANGECYKESISHEEELNSAILGITQEMPCESVDRNEFSEINNYSSNVNSYETVICQEVNGKHEDGNVLNNEEMLAAQYLETNHADNEICRTSDAIGLINSDPPEKSQCKISSDTAKLSPTKQTSSFNTITDLKDVESPVKQNKEVTSPPSIYTDNKNKTPESTDMSELKEKVLTTLSLRKKERNMSFHSSTKGSSPIYLKESGPIHERESASEDFHETGSKEVESSSRETESGNSYVRRFHSTPVDEEFFDNLESLAGVEGDCEGLVKTKLSNGSTLEDSQNLEEKRSGDILPETPKKNLAVKEKSQRKSFSDILKSVSLQFAKVNASPERKTKTIFSDNEEFDNGSLVKQRRGRRKVRCISDTSSNSSDRSWEELIENSVSYSKVVQDKTVSITVSDEGDIIKNISDQSLSWEESMKRNVRKEKRRRQIDSNSREDLAHENKPVEAISSKQVEEKEITHHSTEIFCSIEKQKSQTVEISNTKGDLKQKPTSSKESRVDEISNMKGDMKQKPTSSKESRVDEISNMKGDMKQKPTSSKESRVDEVSNMKGDMMQKPASSKESQVVKRSRNLTQPEPPMFKSSCVNDGAGNINKSRRKRKTETKSSDDNNKRRRKEKWSDESYQELIKPVGQAEREATGTESDRNLFKDIAAVSEKEKKSDELAVVSDNVRENGLELLSNETVKMPENKTYILKSPKSSIQNSSKSDIGNTPISSKSRKSRSTPSLISSQNVQPLSSSSSSILKNDTNQSPLNESNASSTSNSLDNSKSQTESPSNASLSTSQLSTGSTTKIISKKKIGKLMSRLYQPSSNRPPPTPPTGN